MAPRKGAKQAAAADEIVIAAADSNVSPTKKKKTTAKTVAEKPKQAKAGTRRAKAADKRENEAADNEATSSAKKSRGRAKKIVTATVLPKSPTKTINNSAKNKSKKINKQKIKTNTEENNAGEEVLQITEKQTRARATTKKAGAAKKLPAKSKITLSTAKRSKKETAIENGAGDAESAGDEGPSKTTRRRKAAEKSVAPVATKSKTTRKRKNEDNKNFDNEQIIEKEKNTEPVVKKSRRANKVETGAGDVVKLDQDAKVIKPKEKTKNIPAKRPDAAKPETNIEKKIETTEEEKTSPNATLQEDNVKEKSVKRTVTRRKPNTATITESKSQKKKLNVNKKDETKKQKKEQTITEEDDVIIDYIKEDLSVNKNSTFSLNENVAEDNNLSGNDNANNSKEDSINKDSPERKLNLPELERSATFFCL